MHDRGPAALARGGSQPSRRAAGITPLLLGDALEGEAAEVGKVMAGIARSVARHGHPLPPPCVLLSGGETTVTVRGKGPWRPQCRVPAGPGGGPGRACRHLGARRRHGRDRRRRQGGRGHRDARHAWPGRPLSGSSRGRASPTMTGTASSRPWAISSSPAPPSPTSTTSAPS